MIVPGRRGPGPAAVLRGTKPHHATRCCGRPGVHEPVTARDEVGVTVTAIEVAPVPITVGDVATEPVTAGDVERRAPAERPRRSLHRAKGRAKTRGASVLRSKISAHAWEGQGWNADDMEGLK